MRFVLPVIPLVLVLGSAARRRSRQRSKSRRGDRSTLQWPSICRSARASCKTRASWQTNQADWLRTPQRPLNASRRARRRLRRYRLRRRPQLLETRSSRSASTSGAPMSFSLQTWLLPWSRVLAPRHWCCCVAERMGSPIHWSKTALRETAQRPCVPTWSAPVSIRPASGPRTSQPATTLPTTRARRARV